MYQTWEEFFRHENQLEYAKNLHAFLNEEYQKYTVYPPRNLMFRAFQLTPLHQVKVVIIGQDPYHEPGQAMGLCFSVPEGIDLPPSLVNIYKEIENNYSIKMHQNGDLTYLAKQGVLLLNALLSVRRGAPLSHNGRGYELFLQHVMETLDACDQPMVFLLWGSYAKGLKRYLHNPRHLILESTHPSPLSANRGGFFHQNHFVKANAYLKENGLEEIRWWN